MSIQPLARSSQPLPSAVSGIEEVAGAAFREAGVAFAFAAWRLVDELRGRGSGDARPVLLAGTRSALHELGAPFFAGLAGLGLAPTRCLIAVADKEAQALWALDEALRSGTVAGGLVLADAPSLLMTKRLGFAAGKGEALGLVVRPKPVADLSAARMRWQVAALPSAAHPLDRKAPGPPRWRVELTRRRDGPPASWEMEWDDAADGFRLAAGLADHGLGPRERKAAAA